MSKPFAIVTGASSGIGLELAASRFRGLGADVNVVAADLATTAGVDQVWAAAAGRTVDALLVTPAGVLVEQHRKMAEPGSGQKKGA